MIRPPPMIRSAESYRIHTAIVESFHPGEWAMDEPSSLFLDAFTSIEKHLRRSLDADRHMTFHEMVEKASRSDNAVRRLRGQLKDFGDLRNFVVHEYRLDQATATPSRHAVERLQAIRDELLSPPKLIAEFRRAVATCSPSDPVGAATRKMHDGSFSQLPVYDGDRLVDLLTTETVTRWLASRLAGGLGLLEEEAVASVIRHQEGTHYHEVMGREATVEDALAAFDDHLHSGRTLDAIILTHSGKQTERPIGIVTVSDMPKLRGLIQA
jgi:predicted transcriptional regulator